MKFVKSWLSDLPTYRAVRVLKKELEYSQNSEASWWTHFAQRVADYPKRFVRLNLKYSGIQPALDDTSALQDGTLENVANSYIHSITTELNGIARRLVATSFYFEPHTLEEDIDRRITIRGLYTYMLPVQPLLTTCDFRRHSPTFSEWLRRNRCVWRSSQNMPRASLRLEHTKRLVSGN